MFKSFKFFAVAATAVLALTGCEMEIEDGRIPAEYTDLAQQYAGNYAGSFEGRPAHLTLAIAAGNRAVLTYTDAQGHDILGGCGATIGELKGVDIADKKGVLKRARFALNTGSCDITGKDIYLTFNGPNAVQTQIVSHYEFYNECKPGGKGEYCPRRARSIWFSGNFTK